MSSADKSPSFAWLASLSAIVLIGFTAAAAITRLWALTAVPIGFLFGFFLQKGDLCGSSAFSEILLMKDWRKLWGLWVCIVTGMVVFAILDAIGWIQLNPKPFAWALALIGGAVFGAGTVLAGGCISGCLFKAGAGNLNSIVAIFTIALGVSAVEYGPLKGAFDALKPKVISAADGGAMTLPSLTGLSFGAWAAIFAVATLLAGFALRKKGGQAAPAESAISARKILCARSWKPWQAGLAIGLLGGAAYLSSAATGRNYPLGVTHGVLHTQIALFDGGIQFVNLKAPAPDASTPAAASAQPLAPAKKASVWLILLVVSLVAGSWVSGRLSGQAKLLPKPPEQVVTALIGGFLVGIGAAFAGGCVVGNIMSGWALMSVGMFVFGIATILANWVVTYFYLMGGPSVAGGR
ncbi:MAG: putative inner membrane protein [candidate division BRC1 bacterium ADurb.BinA364]|nr:MAG: putative inner membrane protein [candidate division BRC1 bacterium ADurb.BinA364]